MSFENRLLYTIFDFDKAIFRLKHWQKVPETRQLWFYGYLPQGIIFTERRDNLVNSGSDEETNNRV